jgi:hypothetical protein
VLLYSPSQHNKNCLVVRLASSRITKLSSIMHLETSGVGVLVNSHPEIQDMIMHAFEDFPVIPFSFSFAAKFACYIYMDIL